MPEFIPQPSAAARKALFFTLMLAAASSVGAGCGSDNKSSGSSAGGGTGIGTGGVSGSGGAGGPATTSDASAGRGGSSGTSDAGATGAGGSTAGRSDAAAGTCEIPCLATINNDCQPVGACVEQTTGFNSRRCYANGVKVGSEVTIAVMPTIIISHRKPDGSLCFSMEGVLNGQSARLTWKSAAGATVATGTYDTTTMKTTVMCGATSYETTASGACAASLNLPSLPGSAPAPNNCTMGACM